MSVPTVVFTSIAANYLPKARVLANSLKAVAADIQFCIVLVDSPENELNLNEEPFDIVLGLDDLAINDPEQWAFSHSVVELCTAVKGVAAKRLLARPECQRVMYFDPDMVVFGRFSELVEALKSASIVLTPHQTQPEESHEAVMDNEMASLKHGVFNMGFFGVANTSEGNRFLNWWSERLAHFCEDDINRGLFTDQKWANLVPCFFKDYHVLRSPAFNVATWNITTRNVEGSFQEGFTVNGEPLGFYHFSGFDSGDQALMLHKYGADSQALQKLRSWYVEACEAMGQSRAACQPYGYAAYRNGEAVTLAERRLYRVREDLRRAFPDPFACEPKGGYQAWYRLNVGEFSAPVALALDEATSTVSAIDIFADWLGGRARLHTGLLKRTALLFISKALGAIARVAD